MIGLSYNEFIALKPCTNRRKSVAAKFGGARKWGARKITAAEAKAAGMSFDDIVWAAFAMARTDADIERRLRLWSADCVARVLHIYERDNLSPAPRNAIIAGRQFARGEVGDAARNAAGAAAGAAAWAAEGAWQYDRLIARLSDDEPEDWPLPELPIKQAAE